jgi:hypothetical protein
MLASAPRTQTRLTRQVYIDALELPLRTNQTTLRRRELVCETRFRSNDLYAFVTLRAFTKLMNSGDYEGRHNAKHPNRLHEESQVENSVWRI